MFAPAARVGDMHACPMVTPGTPPVPHVGGPILPKGEPTVLIAGMPAARLGDMAQCVGPPDSIVMGSFTVLVGGQPAARIGDQCAHGGAIVAGCPTVLIGDQGGGAGGSAPGTGTEKRAGGSPAATMSRARAEAKPFTRASCAADAVIATPGNAALHQAGDPSKRSWIDIELVDDDGEPVPYERYRVKAPDGTVFEGYLDANGQARVSGIDPGSCDVTFPGLDREVWQ